MRAGTLWRVLALWLLSVAAWGQEDDDHTDDSTQKLFTVSISGTRVVLTCPLEAEADIHWETNTKSLPDRDKELDLENFSEMEDSGYYSCYTGTKDKKENEHILYLKARVCEACMEVDLTTVASIVVVDVCVTLGLLLLVYYWSKNRKAKCKPVTRGAGAGGRPRGQNKERPPPVPNPDYEKSVVAIFRDLKDFNVFKARNMASLLPAFSRFLQKHNSPSGKASGTCILA